MEEQLNPLAITHLLQHTLRTLCLHDTSTPWLYAVFWRILPRNYPPPKWDLQGGAYDHRSRENRRNWILVWEDGFCNFSASISGQAIIDVDACGGCSGSSSAYHMKGFLQPELFFKMSHEIYNYGEGLIGKVAADHSHKWVYNDPQDQEINPLSACNNPVNSHPRSWEAQFQSGIKTIALIAVREGVVQLGAMNKVAEDLSYVVQLRNKFSYLESIPGVLLPHPSPSTFPVRIDTVPENWPAASMPTRMEYHDHFSQQLRITPSMSSLEALLSTLPSVGAAPLAGYYTTPVVGQQEQSPRMVTKEEMMEEEEEEEELDGGERSNSMASYNIVNTNERGEGF